MPSILFGILTICSSLFKWNYLKTEKLFLNFSFRFCVLHQNLNIFNSKMIVIANAFPKLQTLKNLVRTLSKKRRFRTSFDSQHVKRSQTLVKSAWEYFYHICSSPWWEINWEVNLLLICQILGLFFNTLAADGKYRLQDCEILPLLVQMKLSKNRKKKFSEFSFSIYGI